MSNINLLDGKELNRENDKPDPDSVSFQDFQAPEPEPEKIEKPADTVAEQKPKEEIKRPVDDAPDFSRSSNWPVIGGIGGVIIIVIVLIFVFTRNRDTVDTQTSSGITLPDSSSMIAEPDSEAIIDNPPQLTQQSKPEQKPIEKPEKVTSNEKIETIYSNSLSETRKTGVTGASLFGDFISSSSSGATMSFFRYGNGVYFAEIKAVSEVSLTQFMQKLRQKNRFINVKVLSKRDEFIGRQDIIIQQIGGKLVAGNQFPRANITLASNQIRRELNKTAQKFNFQVKQIDVSPTVSFGNSSFFPATLKTLGQQNKVAGFIQDLMNSFGNVGVSKMMVSAVSTSNPNDTNIMLTLDLDIYKN